MLWLFHVIINFGHKWFAYHSVNHHNKWLKIKTYNYNSLQLNATLIKDSLSALNFKRVAQSPHRRRNYGFCRSPVNCKTIPVILGSPFCMFNNCQLPTLYCKCLLMKYRCQFEQPCKCQLQCIRETLHWRSLIIRNPVAFIYIITNYLSQEKSCDYIQPY